MSDDGLGVPHRFRGVECNRRRRRQSARGLSRPRSPRHKSRNPSARTVVRGRQERRGARAPERILYMKWEDVFGWVFRGGLRRGTQGAAGVSPKLARGGADFVAGQVARTTFRIFKNNLFALPWIKDGEELSGALDGARADLLRSRNAYRKSPVDADREIGRVLRDE